MPRMNGPIADCYWVVPGRLLAGEYPGARQPERARERLQAFVDAGVRSFLDLTERHELEPYEAHLRDLMLPDGHIVTYRRMSIRDAGVPSVMHMQNVLAYIQSEIDAGRPVYVHCWGGVGRTGTVVGCWMVQCEARTAEDALIRIAQLRAGTTDARRTSPETPAQRDFIFRWSGEAGEAQGT
jgi:protein tyrosine/serine phosphatase